ncbi:MAG: hypothetical protein ABI877_14145 [Gemmatimonadaceae bacterium]
MGLHINYELSLPLGLVALDAVERISLLRQQAIALPFDEVSEMVHLTEEALAGPLPTRGLHYRQLEDVVHIWAVLAREDLYRRSMGISDDEREQSRTVVPPALRTLAHAFAVHPGRGSEPATFGFVQLTDPNHASLPRWWYGSCKTQYASVVSDEHLLRCHASVVALLDNAMTLGFDVVVRDETGYWESRNPALLLESVAEMNRMVARFAGTFTDAVRDAAGDSRQVQGAIFEHPDFERLESDAEP